MKLCIVIYVNVIPTFNNSFSRYIEIFSTLIFNSEINSMESEATLYVYMERIYDTISAFIDHFFSTRIFPTVQKFNGLTSYIL